MKNGHPSLYILFLAFCWLHLLTSSVFAADKVLDISIDNNISNNIDNSRNSNALKIPVSLTEYFAVLEDPSLKLTLADIQRPEIANRFKGDIPPASDLHYGYTSSAYWLRMRLKNSSTQRLERMLEIHYPSLSFVELHKPLNEGSISAKAASIRTGVARPFTTRPYRNRQFVFPIALAAQSEQVFYLRIESTNSVIIPARLWVPEAFHEYQRNDYLNQAMYFGMVIALTLFNLLLFLALRDVIYLLYVIFVSCSAFVIATHTGLAHEFLWPGASAWPDISTFTAYSLAVSAFIFFMRLMINTRELMPRTDKVLKIAGIIYLFTPIAFIISISSTAKLATIINFLWLLIVLSIGLFGIYKKQRSAYFFLAAFSLLMIGVAAVCLRTLGFLYTNTFTVNGLHFGMAAEMVLLAFAVADRFNQIRLEKGKAEMNTLLAQNQLAQSEKMAALGHLIASVSHEINTPVGAVKSSGKTISNTLGHALLNMPKLFQSLDADSTSRFLALIKGAHAPAAILSSREERAITLAVSGQLEAAGIEGAHQKAGILVRLNAHSQMTKLNNDYLPLLRHAQAELILNTANSMATIINSTNNINTAVDSVAKMILALKSFSRVNHQATKIETDLRESLETVLTIYQGKFRHGTELIRQYEDIAPLSCLPDELNQIWTNLIQNALQAMNHEGTLTLGIRRIGDEAVVSVGDTGGGIPEAIRDKIFNLFFTTKPAGQGSGLGLDIVKKIIEKHQGRVEFKSDVGIGTTFFVYLPYTAK